MDFKQVVSLFEKGLNQPLPGKIAHHLMSPIPVDLERFDFDPKKNHRKGAVLILLYPKDHNAFFPLIKRPDYQGVHSGQIAFPGGKMEPSDADEIQTALREASEEVGIYPDKVRILGKMSDLYIPASNFLVSPVLGFSETQPDFKAEEREVARIMPTAIQDLYLPEFRKQKLLEISPDIKIETPYFEVEKEIVWGATAMILSELLQIMNNGRL
jgi:8-oxo-dGTP pyrophosphatase MutT (NUDIX family)